MDSSVGGAPGSRYNDLLRTVSSLQSDLQEALGVTARLNAENEGMKQALDQAQVEAGNMRKQFLRARNDLIAETEQKAGFSERLSRMSKLLEQERRSFNQQISQLQAPTSVDEIRHEEQQRLEGAHKDELERVQAQARQFQEMWFNTRRDHELVLEEYADFKGALERQLDEAHGRHHAQVEELKRQLGEAEARSDGLAREEHSRTVAKEAERLRISEAHLKGAVHTLEAELQALREDLDARGQKHESELNQLHCRITAEAADRRAVDRQRREAVLSLERARADQEEAEREARGLRGEVQRLTQQGSLKDGALESGRKAAEQRFEDAKATWELLKGKLESDLSRSEERCDLAEAARRTAEDALAVSERSCRELEQRARDVEDALRRDYEEQGATLRASVADLRQREQDSANSHADEVSSLRLQTEALHTEKLRLVREKDALHGKNKAQQNQIASLTAEAAAARRKQQEIEKEHQELQASHRALREAQHDEKTSAAQLLMKVQYLEDDLATAAANAERERERHVVAIGELQTTHSGDADELRRQCEEMAETISAARQLHAKELGKATRRADQYKQKAMEVHESHKAAKQALSQGRRQWEAQRRELEGQVTRLSQRVEQMEEDRLALQKASLR